MSRDPGGLDITLLGRQFRVACREGEKKDLLKAVEYLDAKMREIRDSGKVIGMERIAVMAALNITHEYLSARSGDGIDVGDLEGRMRQMRTLIEETISAQDELFK
ncbi:MAG: cell division protein ZapA [Burkholderiales bacterium]